ncbi:hypothetical protein AAV99_01890 [Aurantiacibacter marinus]|uniref:Uncharacterized protein n=2 Tax=Aurantiacibacter marinus TaxID=874156 RepID=A0A0H0XP82_9SPHN|nr:hypothetical protein AAV99_01890 [Aurantiacibacter marinus]
MVVGFPALAQNAGPQMAPRSATAFAQYVDASRTECASFDDGVLAIEYSQIDQTTDFDGDGLADAIFDSAGLNCSTSASFSGGTGGTILSIFLSADGGTRQMQMQGYQILHSRRVPILLLALHGSACDRYGYQACFAAYSFVDGSFVAAGGAVRE